MASLYSISQGPSICPRIQNSPPSQQVAVTLTVGFSGIPHFAHLKHVKCLSGRDVPFDIGTGKTVYNVRSTVDLYRSQDVQLPEATLDSQSPIIAMCNSWRGSRIDVTNAEVLR